MKDFIINSKTDLINAINEFGFLPFFANSIEGFSIEEHITRDCWYDSDDGVWNAWEWKGPVIRETGCAYGKFFEKKATANSLKRRRAISAPNGFLILRITAATVTTLTHATTTVWQITATSLYMSWLILTRRLFQSVLNSSVTTKRAATRALIQLLRGCKVSVMSLSAILFI